jgi:hypothetical protein
MASLPGFTVDIDHNPYLPAGGRDVSAVVTVTVNAQDHTPPERSSDPTRRRPDQCVNLV